MKFLIAILFIAGALDQINKQRKSGLERPAEMRELNRRADPTPMRTAVPGSSLWARLSFGIAACYRPDMATDPLHGVTLEQMVTALVEYFGWTELGERIPVRCFTHDPSVPSSLKFLRRTPWARAKTEGLYGFMLREQRRRQRRPTDTAGVAPIVPGEAAGPAAPNTVEPQPMPVTSPRRRGPPT